VAARKPRQKAPSLFDADTGPPPASSGGGSAPPTGVALHEAAQSRYLN
jgi:hypothetical protein